MGFRFHRSFQLIPGIRLNLSKSGPSVSLGTKGATINFNGKRTRTTVGLPGTGLSYSRTSTLGAHSHSEAETSETEPQSHIEAASDEQTAPQSNANIFRIVTIVLLLIIIVLLCRG